MKFINNEKHDDKIYSNALNALRYIQFSNIELNKNKILFRIANNHYFKLYCNFIKSVEITNDIKDFTIQNITITSNTINSYNKGSDGIDYIVKDTYTFVTDKCTFELVATLEYNTEFDNLYYRLFEVSTDGYDVFENECEYN